MVLIGGNLALAYAITSQLSASLVPHYSWRILWLTGLPTGVLLILLNRWIPESPRFLLAYGRDEEARQIMAKYGAVETDQAQVEIAEPDTDHGNYLTLFRKPHARVSLAVVVLGLGIGLVTYGFQLWIPSNLQKLGLSQSTASRALGDSALLGLPLVFIAAAMYGLWSAKKTIVVLTTLVSVTLLVFSVEGQSLVHNRSWLFLVLAGPIVGTATIAAVLAAYSSEIYPTRIRSRGSGMSAGVGKLGGVIVTTVLVAGATIPSIGTTALLGAIPLLLAIATFAFFGVEPQAQTAGESTEPTGDLQPAEA
jgi:MFS transporter, putative metabolite:H+ symporter